MAAARGREMLIQVALTSNVYTTVGLLITKTFSITSGAIDVTDFDSDDWRTLDDRGLGDRAIDASGAGVLDTTNAALVYMENAVWQGYTVALRLMLPNGDYYEGTFKVPTFDRSGDISGAVPFSMSMESSGPITLNRFSVANVYSVTTNSAGLLLIAGADGKMATSANAGVTWTLDTTAPFGTDTIYAVDYDTGNSIFISGGAGGKLFTSPGAISWTPQAVGFGTDTIRVVWGDDGWNNRLYVGGDNGKLFRSAQSDVTTWTALTSSYGTDKVLAIGISGFTENGYTSGGAGKFAVSVDYVAWTQQANVFGSSDITGFGLIGSSIIAVGYDGKIFTSTNSGAAWTARTSTFGTDNISAVAISTGTTLLAVGAAGKMALSTDTGATWAAVADSSFGTTNIRDVVWDSNSSIWVAVGDAGKVATSPDAITWTQQASGF